MKQRLLKTIALGLMAMVGVNAWADNTVTVKVGEASTGYATLKAAIEAEAFKSPSGNIEVSISADQSLGTQVISWEPTAGTGYTLTIKATQDITIKGPNGSRWFTVKNNGANLVVGDGNYEITLDGEYSGGTTKQRTNPVALHNNNSSNITFNKVTFANFNLNNAVNMIVGEKGAGTITLQDVTISNCVNPKDAYIDNLCTNNDKVLLKGTFTIDNESSGTEFKTTYENESNRGRIKVDDSDFSASRVLKIKYTSMPTAIGSGPVVVRTQGTTANIIDYFDLDEDEYGFYMTGNDLKITQAYTLTVSDALAATLVLPFATAALPANTSAYDLSYSGSGNDITASPVSVITANDPVLVTATAAGKYKYISTATSGDAATGSGQTSANGVLIGNYANSFYAPINSYILTNHTGSVAFRKVTKADTNLVKPYRAYMSVSGPSAPEYLGIDFGDGNVTAIDAVEKEAVLETGDIYNLQGVRMTGDNLPKGIYVKNGKKFVVK